MLFSGVSPGRIPPHTGTEAVQGSSRVQPHRPLTSPLATRSATEPPPPAAHTPSQSSAGHPERGDSTQYKHTTQLQPLHHDGAASLIDQGPNISREEAGPGSAPNTNTKSSPATQQNTQATGNNIIPEQNIANPEPKSGGIVSNNSKDSTSNPGLIVGVKLDTNPDLLDEINISINPAQGAEVKSHALKDSTLSKHQRNLKVNTPVRLPSTSESSSSSGIITSSSGESFGAAFGVVNGSSSGDSLSASSAPPGDSSCSSTTPPGGRLGDNAMSYEIKSRPASSSNDEDPGYASVDEIPLDSPGKCKVRHEKTDRKVFVVVIPKEGWAHVVAPILLLA